MKSREKEPLCQILYCEIWCFDNIRHFGIFASEWKFHPFQIEIKQLSQNISILKETMLIKDFSQGALHCIGWSQEEEKWPGFYLWLCPVEKCWFYRQGLSFVTNSRCEGANTRCSWRLQRPCGQGGCHARASPSLSANSDLPSCPLRHPNQLSGAGVIWKSGGWLLPKAGSHVHHAPGRRGRCSARKWRLQSHRGWFPPCPSSWTTFMSRHDAILTGGLKCR